jgi:peptide/nickel transport system substrate-binding protein
MGFRRWGERMPWAVLLSVLLLAGCAPPPVTQERSVPSDLRPIVTVKPQWPGPYQTRVMGGTEFRESRDPVGRYGGTLTAGQIGDGPKTLNPWASYDATSSALGGAFISGLVDTDAYTGEVVPALAKSFTVLPDRCTYRVTLRRGLTWSDGKSLTVDDVVFTWNQIVKPGLGNPSTRDNLLVDGQFPLVRKVDAHTIEFKTAKPFSPFLRQLSQGIAPKHVFEPIIRRGGNAAFSSAWGTEEATEHPERFISSGMWLLERYEPGERIVFKRNPHFYMVDAKGQRLPYLDKQVIVFVKDLNNLALRFEQGLLDTYSVPGKYLTHVRRLRSPEFVLYNLGPTTSTSFLTFNLARRNNPQTGQPLVDTGKSDWFNNQKFRAAVDYAIHREEMVMNILMGVGKPLFTAESLSSIFLNQALAKGHERNLNKARQLLTEAGFTWDHSGHLRDAQGRPVAFTLFTNTGNDEREATGVSIKQDLSELGITVHFKPMDFNVLVGRINQGDWEAIILGLTGTPLEPHSGANVWKSQSALHMFLQRGNGYSPPPLPWEAEIDRIFDQGALTFDFQDRKRLYDRFQHIVYEQRPFIYLYSPLSLVAIRSRLQNVNPTALDVMHNMEAIWVQTP